MTNTHSPKFRTASTLLAGLTIGLTVTALAASPASAASADDLSPWTVTHDSPAARYYSKTLTFTLSTTTP